MKDISNINDDKFDSEDIGLIDLSEYNSKETIKNLEDIEDIEDIENIEDIDDIDELEEADTAVASEVTKKSAKADSKSKGKKKKKKKLTKKQRLVYNILFFVFGAVFVFSAGYLIKYFWGVYQSEKKYDELRDLIQDDSVDISGNDDLASATDITVEPEFVEIDGVKVQYKYAKLYERNHDFIGWLTIGDTVIDYPVMQCMNNNEYYLRKDFDGKYNEAGTLFADNSCDVKTPGDNIIIYGHNMKSGKMFHTLTDYEKESHYEKYKYIEFNTIYEDGVYEVIAAFYTQIYDEDYTGFKYYTFFNASSPEDFDRYVNNCRRLTPYETSTAEYGDKLITLSTCAYHTDNGRFVVVAKKVDKKLDK